MLAMHCIHYDMLITDVSLYHFSHHSVVLGIIFTCVASLMLITLTVTSCFFIRKTVTAKKGLPVVPDHI